MGLVSSGYSRALLEVAELLTDSEPPVRSGAARAVACGNPREAELLLRAKVLAGDEEPLVIGDCFAGLLTVEPDESVSFVARYLDADDEAVCEAAALALGESRLPAALDTLTAAWDGVLVSPEYRRVLIRAAALHRSDEAFNWLLELLAASDARIAAEIVDVLSIYRHNEKLRKRLSGIIESRGDAAPRAMFDQAWG
jgi:HEAT repeat protein